MKIFKMMHLSDGFKAIDIKETSSLFNTIDKFNGLRVKLVQNNETFNWVNNGGEKELVSDFPFIYGFIPTFSERAYKILESFIDQCNIQIIPIKVDGQNYFVLNVMDIYEDILNTKKSDIIYFRNGEIMDIENYVFLPTVQNVTPIFRVSQLDTYIFVTDDVYDTIISNEFTGASFTECPIKSQGFWK